MPYITSQPIPMVQDNKQINAVKMYACYMYKTSGSHVLPGSSPSVTDALMVEIHGIDKTGSDNLIAKCPLYTTDGYTANTFASSVVTGIPVKDYPFIYWRYNSEQSQDWNKFVSQPFLAVEAREYPDVLDNTVLTNAIIDTI